VKEVMNWQIHIQPKVHLALLIMTSCDGNHPPSLGINYLFLVD